MKAFRRLVSLLAIALVFMLGIAVAQEKPAAHPAPSKAEHQAQHPQKAAGEQHPSASEKAESPGEALAEASEHAAGEDENAEFKQSASVQFLARITGLKLKQAYWLAILLNFAVIAAAVIWFMRSKLPGMFRARAESIRKTMDEAQRASADANRRLSEIENRLAKLDSEVAAMRAQAEADAAAEEQRIKAAADEDARKIVESAAQEVEAASRLAQRELKSYAADLAVSLAEKRIQVDATTDRALVETFVGQLGKNGEGR
jgi:F-type H+-transporting ATPase subunit b